jgi:hypothetical protein
MPSDESPGQRIGRLYDSLLVVSRDYYILESQIASQGWMGMVSGWKVLWERIKPSGRRAVAQAAITRSGISDYSELVMRARRTLFGDRSRHSDAAKAYLSPNPPRQIAEAFDQRQHPTLTDLELLQNVHETYQATSKSENRTRWFLAMITGLGVVGRLVPKEFFKHYHHADAYVGYQVVVTWMVVIGAILLSVSWTRRIDLDAGRSAMTDTMDRVLLQLKIILKQRAGRQRRTVADSSTSDSS